jgi:predicted RNA-binding Zn ribbon-like protein
VIVWFDPAGLPILGEPFAVEFANTLYRVGDDVNDFLAEPDRATAWFAHAPDARNHVPPASLTDAILANVREIRNATHALCTYVTRHSPADPHPASAVAVLNRYASRVANHVELAWPDAAKPTATVVHHGDPDDVLLAQIANATISFMVGPDRVHLRQCATPVCELFFVPRHHRRNFCSEPCSQRTRQARYYDKKRHG